MNTCIKGNSKLYSVQDLDDTFVWGDSPEMAVRDIDKVFKWVPLSAETDLPDEKYVLDGYKFNGNKVGTLGKINKNSLDIDEQIRNKVAEMIEFDLTTYKPLSYLFDLPNNNFTQNKLRYGVYTKSVTEQPAINCTIMTADIQVALVNGYTANGTNDDYKKAIRIQLEKDLEQLRRRITNTRAGAFRNAYLGNNWYSPEIEFNDQDGIAIVRANFSVEYHTKL